MLPKNRRIPRKDFSIVLSGKRYNYSHFLVYISKTKEKTPSLFSFSVSKKVANTAVLRNKLRRQGYFIVSKYIKNINNGYFVFFSYKKDKYPILFSKIESEITQILRDVGILN